MPNAELQNVSLHYEVSGPAAAPVIVLVNSLGTNLHLWDKVVPFLEQDFRVLRYDARGHGSSTVPALPYSIEQLGEDLLNLLDSLTIETAHLCGLSLGGLVCLWIGFHAPRRVRRLVLANTAARIGSREGWHSRIEEIQSRGMAFLAQDAPARNFSFGYRREHSKETDEILKMIEQTPAEGYMGCCVVLRDTDLRDTLAAISLPCLVIAGRHDAVTTPDEGRALHSGLRHSEYVELDSAHLSAWEQPAEFASAILDFFKRKEHLNG
jgi:3-oxoadipate enol-lactonase